MKESSDPQIGVANLQTDNLMSRVGLLQIRFSSIVMSVSVAKMQLIISQEGVMARQYKGNCGSYLFLRRPP